MTSEGAEVVQPSVYKDLVLEPRGGVEVKSKGKGAPRPERGMRNIACACARAFAT